MFTVLQVCQHTRKKISTFYETINWYSELNHFNDSEVNKGLRHDLYTRKFNCIEKKSLEKFLYEITGLRNNRVPPRAS